MYVGKALHSHCLTIWIGYSAAFKHTLNIDTMQYRGVGRNQDNLSKASSDMSVHILTTYQL